MEPDSWWFQRPPAEQGRSQRCCQRQFVGGVVDGSQGGEEVADLVGGKWVEACLDAVRYAGIGERLGEGVDRGAATDEDRDVAGFAGSPGFDGGATVGAGHHLVDDRPPLGEGRAHGGGYVGRRRRTEFVGTALGGIVGAEHHHRGTGGAVDPGGDQWRVLGLCPRHVVDEAFEHGVDPVEDGSCGPEVLLEVHGVVAEGRAGVEVDSHVGPSEPVDRLLGIADEEQRPGTRSQAAPVARDGVGVGDQGRQLDLEGVGVLELVEQEVPVVVGEGGTYGQPVDRVGQHASGQDQQVVEAELSLPSPVLGSLYRPAAHDLDEPVDDLVVESLHLGVDAIAGRPEPVAHIADRDAASPLLLAARVPAAGDVLAVAQDPDDGQVVAFCLFEPVGEQVDQIEPIDHRVGFGGAVFAQLDHLAQFGDQRCDVDRLGIGGGCQTGVDEVPVLVEAAGHAAELVETDAELEADQDRGGVTGVAEQRVDDAGPALVEVDQRRHLVHDLDRRWQAGLDGVLDEYALGEGVEGAQRRAVELHERPGGGIGIGARAGRQGFEVPSDPVSELCGGPVGEGDGGDVLDGNA